MRHLPVRFLFDFLVAHYDETSKDLLQFTLFRYSEEGGGPTLVYALL